MGSVENRAGRYRAKYRDPLGRQRSETFTRKADAERFLREMQVQIDRGQWLDPRGADIPLAEWAKDFLSLCRRLSPLSQEAYQRDITKYVLPRFGAYRIGRLPADEIENWLNDEIAAGLAPSSVHSRRSPRSCLASTSSASASLASTVSCSRTGPIIR